MRKIVVYVSGKYTANTKEEIARNIALARKHAIAIWEAGMTALCPHLNTQHFEEDCNIKWEDYLDGDFALLDNCSVILMLHNSHDSKGAEAELRHSVAKGIPVFYSYHENDFHYINDIKAKMLLQAGQKSEVGVKEDAGIKFDSEKLRYDLIDYNQIDKLAYILTHGARKYADNNWKSVKPFSDRYFAAIMRHLTAWRNGQIIDKESGKSHLDHAFCNLMFLMWKEDNPD